MEDYRDGFFSVSQKYPETGEDVGKIEWVCEVETGGVACSMKVVILITKTEVIIIIIIQVLVYLRGVSTAW
jgi:hypothetical protein